MENRTLGIDTQISKNYRSLMTRLEYDSSSDEEDMMAGSTTGALVPVTQSSTHNASDSRIIQVPLPRHDLCTCTHINPQSIASYNYSQTKTMWYGEPAHMHDGSYSDCVICGGMQGCSDIPRLLESGDTFRSLMAGAPKKSKAMVDCSTNVIPAIAQEANKVLSYIYAQYKNTENNQPITEGMISQAVQNLKLNVLSSDIPRVIELVISKHKRGLGRSDYIEHPLSYVICHMKELINPLLVFEKSIEGYSYNELLNNLRLQSAEYDQSILEKLPLKFDISTMIHPIFVAMFWRQLPTVEGMCVESDQFQLLKNIHITQDKIKPSSINFELITARWNEKSPVAFFGVTNVIDTEIKRVMCHVYLKKIIYRLRTGELHSIDSNKLISWLQKVFIFNSYDTADEAEQLITAFLNVFLIRPIKLFIQDQIAIGNNCGYLINTPADDYMKECPFIYCETTSQIGGTPYPAMPTDLSCLRYDKIKNKAVLNLGAATNIRQPIVMGSCQSGVTCSGLLPIFTRRKAALTYRDPSLLSNEDAIEYINTSPLSIMSEYSIDGKDYRLVSALCYHTIKQEPAAFLADKEVAAGYYALVASDDDGWFKYNTNAFSGVTNVDALSKKYLEWAMREYQTHEIVDVNGVKTNELKLSEGYLKDMFHQKFGNGVIDAPLLKISRQDAMDLLGTHSCLLLYAEDYQTFKINRRNRMVT